jgi:hypothetical protein
VKAVISFVLICSLSRCKSELIGFIPIGNKKKAHYTTSSLICFMSQRYNSSTGNVNKTENENQASGAYIFRYQSRCPYPSVITARAASGIPQWLSPESYYTYRVPRFLGIQSCLALHEIALTLLGQNCSHPESHWSCPIRAVLLSLKSYWLI